MRALAAAALASALASVALGQAPLSVGVGQYCSYYFSGFNRSNPVVVNAISSGRVQINDYGYGYETWRETGDEFGGSYSTICFNQANSLKLCPWEVTSSYNKCNLFWPYDWCNSDSPCACSYCYQSIINCYYGCAAVSACILPANSLATSAASPITNASGCSYTCNVGYVKQGGLCASCGTCSPGSYISGCSSPTVASCVACGVCGTGSYLVGCGGTSPGSCVACGACSSGYYRAGCSGTSSGSCVACGTCSSGYYLKGCSGTSPGVCLSTAPITLGVGQYCSNYFSAYDENTRINLGALTYTYNGIAVWIDFADDSSRSNICYNDVGSLGLCPWSRGTYCKLSSPYAWCWPWDAYCCEDGCWRTMSECTMGCASVAPCVIPANSLATSAASPVTNASGCSYTCNSGYVAQGGLCVAASPSCSVGFYPSGGTCVPCTNQ